MAMKHLPQWQWVPGRRLSRPLLAALVAGLMAGGGLLYWKVQLDAQMARSAQQLSRVKELSARMAPHPKPPLPQLSPAATRALDRQVVLLNRDWVRLSVLLAPKNQSVHLLGMDVDPATGAIRLSGSVDSTTVANGYAQALSQHAGSLGQVRLLGLERQADGIHFEIGAQWIH